MQASYFLARLIGPFCLILGIGVLASGANYRAMAEEFLNSRAMMFLSGLLSLPAGLAIVLTHNVWVMAWPVLITILGWLLIVGGTARIVIPDFVIAKARSVVARPGHRMLAVGIWLVLGAILSFFGYIQTT